VAAVRRGGAKQAERIETAVVAVVQVGCRRSRDEAKFTQLEAV